MQSVQATPLPSFSAGQQQLPLAPSGRRRANVSDACVDLLVLETVSFFSLKDGGVDATQALDAVGARVGRQLAERCDAAAGRRFPAAKKRPTIMNHAYTDIKAACLPRQRPMPCCCCIRSLLVPPA